MGGESNIVAKLDEPSQVELTGEDNGGGNHLSVLSGHIRLPPPPLCQMVLVPPAQTALVIPLAEGGALNFAAGYQGITAAAALRRGLDPSALKTIPVVEFSPKDFKDGLECAVCLCEVSEGEKARLLPKCNHGFHVECIDMWFQSHSTCPLCRNPIPNPPPAETASVEGLVHGETPNFPTNVLFWGDETQVSTLGTGLDELPQQGSQQGSISSAPSSSSCPSSSTSSSVMGSILVIDIPRHVVEDDQEQKSPMPTRLRSLKRLLSREKRVSPRTNVDIEQGGRSQS